jgi:hypothetical protein
MSKIKLNLQRLNIPEKLARSRQIVAALTGNADFTSPQPTLTEITDAINKLAEAFDAAQAARQEAKAKTLELNRREDTHDRLLTQLAAYVESASNGDENKIMGARMDLRSLPTGMVEVEAPASLSTSAGDRDGEMDLRWDKVERARSYVIEFSPDPPTPTSWTHAAVSTKSQFTVGGLTSGTRYWFRVAAVGPLGQSPWSEPATKTAP